MLGWQRFVRVTICCFASMLVLLSVFILLMNPYGNLPRILFSEHVISDKNQRFQYPALVRSQRYDSIVIGTSDSRLLQPRALERVFGGRFANLALNDGRAYEQYRLAALFIEEVEKERTLLVGLDHAWCYEQADKERITFRGFPEWMYDADWHNDLRYMLNAKTVEISGRRFGQAIGLRGPRFVDGYEVFTPPESSYDPVKVENKLWGKKGPTSIDPAVPPYTATDEERAGWQYPALGWLDELSVRFGGRVVFIYAPTHITAQPRPGSAEAARREECKRRIATIAGRHDIPFIDFNIRSEITANDANWWDRLHYRLPIADRVVAGIERALQTGHNDPEGDWRYLEGPAHRGSFSRPLAKRRSAKASSDNQAAKEARACVRRNPGRDKKATLHQNVTLHSLTLLLGSHEICDL